MLGKMLSRIGVSNTSQEEKKSEDEMSFLEHLEELRWHILRSLVWVTVFAIVAFIAKNFLFRQIIFAPRYEDFLSYRWLCSFSHWVGMGETLCLKPPVFDVQAIGFGELFTTHLKVAFFAGIIVAIPFIFWEIWRFIRPGLYESERKAARGFVTVSSLLFVAGVLFGYYIIAPFSVSFLAGYEIEGAKAAPSLESYVNYMVMFTIPVGLVFQLPIVVYFLSKIGIMTPEFMKTYRRHAIVIILLVAAIVTPPDVMTQLMVSFPLIILYELSILVSARVVRQQKQKEQAEEANNT